MRYLLPVLLAVLLACGADKKVPDTKTGDLRSEAVRAQAAAFFATYAERSDWHALLSYYREDMQFEDVLLQIHLDSLWQLERFYNWPDTNFRKLSPGQQHLEVDHLLVNDSVAVATGHFNPFYWHGQLKDLGWGMQFHMTLYFDDKLKITKQIDWIEYDDTVLEEVIGRYRKVGVDQPPSWLDLEKR